MMIKNHVILKNKHIGNAESTGFANDLQMTEQASVSPSGMGPVRGDTQIVAIHRRKPADRVNSMAIEFEPHLLPAIRSSIEIDADLIWERLVYESSYSLPYRFAHVLQFHSAFSGGLGKPVRIDENVDGLSNCLTLADIPQRLDANGKRSG
jgi:hypothetical protein